jgi:hypothetical protein
MQLGIMWPCNWCSIPRVNAGSSAAVEALNKWAGEALAVTRQRLGDARGEPLGQSECAVWAASILGLAPFSRFHWTNLENGKRMVPAALLVGLVEAAGLELNEVLTQALHEMALKDTETIAVATSTPKPPKKRRSRPTTRTARLTADLMAAELRAAGGAEHPPGDPMDGREQGESR